MIEAGLWGLLAAGSLLLRRARGRVAATPGASARTGDGLRVRRAAEHGLVRADRGSCGDREGLRATFFGLFVGAIVFTVGDYAIANLGPANHTDVSGEPQEAGGLPIVLGVLLDGIPESAVLGLTLLETGEIGVTMLVAVFVSNVPEAIATRRSVSTTAAGQPGACTRCGA